MSTQLFGESFREVAILVDDLLEVERIIITEEAHRRKAEAAVELHEGSLWRLKAAYRALALLRQRGD
jgi:hypothetical protein